MSLPDNQLDPPGAREFTCFLCGDVKPLDDLSVEATYEYDHSVCYRCGEENNP